MLDTPGGSFRRSEEYHRFRYEILADFSFFPDLSVPERRRRDCSSPVLCYCVYTHTHTYTHTYIHLLRYVDQTLTQDRSSIPKSQKMVSEDVKIKRPVLAILKMDVAKTRLRAVPGTRCRLHNLQRRHLRGNIGAGRIQHANRRSSKEKIKNRIHRPVICYSTRQNRHAHEEQAPAPCLVSNPRPL